MFLSPAICPCLNLLSRLCFLHFLLADGELQISEFSPLWASMMDGEEGEEEQTAPGPQPQQEPPSSPSQQQQQQTRAVGKQPRPRPKSKAGGAHSGSGPSISTDLPLRGVLKGVLSTPEPTPKSGAPPSTPKAYLSLANGSSFRAGGSGLGGSGLGGSGSGESNGGAGRLQSSSELRRLAEWHTQRAQATVARIEQAAASQGDGSLEVRLGVALNEYKIANAGHAEGDGGGKEGGGNNPLASLAKQFDKNSDGLINKLEVRSRSSVCSCSSSARSHSFPDPRYLGPTPLASRSCPLCTQFRAAVRQLLGVTASSSEIDTLFRRFDTDGTANLDRRALRGCFRTLQEAAAEEDRASEKHSGSRKLVVELERKASELCAAAEAMERLEEVEGVEGARRRCQPLSVRVGWMIIDRGLRVETLVKAWPGVEKTGGVSAVALRKGLADLEMVGGGGDGGRGDGGEVERWFEVALEAGIEAAQYRMGGPIHLRTELVKCVKAARMQMAEFASNTEMQLLKRNATSCQEALGLKTLCAEVAAIDAREAADERERHSAEEELRREAEETAGSAVAKRSKKIWEK